MRRALNDAFLGGFRPGQYVAVLTNASMVLTNASMASNSLSPSGLTPVRAQIAFVGSQLAEKCMHADGAPRQCTPSDEYFGIQPRTASSRLVWCAFKECATAATFFQH